MEIDEGSLDNGLDQETWLKIFGYLPKSDRENVLLVNRLFYKLICEIEKFQYVLRVTEQNLTDIRILLTKRKFNEVKFHYITFNDLHLMAMCEILRVHGKTIETMTVSSGINKTKDRIKTIPSYRILSLFELVPNLKKLDWNTPYIQIKDWYAPDPLLEKLEHLKLNIYEETSLEFAYIFTPGTIKTLNIERKWKYLKEFLACQLNIKNLILEKFDTNIDVTVFNKLKLDSLIVHENKETTPILIQMLGQHPELKKVNRNGYCLITSLPLLITFCSLVNLESLELVLKNETLNEVHRITELPNLREIKLDLFDEIYGYNEDTVLGVASIQLPKIEKVSLAGNETTVLFLETAGQNWPNVKDLEVEVSSKFFDGIDVLNYYLDNFNQLESLVIKTDSFYEMALHQETKTKIIPFEMLSFISRLQQYPHLKSLTVEGSGILHLEHLITALPNLELLHIDERCFNIYSTHCLINLLQHKQLKDLRVKFTEQSNFGRFSAQEAAWLKKLCRRLKSFRITFEGNDDFQESIRTLLRGCDTFTVKRERAYYSGYELFTLENVKY